MSKYSAFRNRVKASGETHLDGFRNSTKRQIRNYIQNSPSRSTVELLQLEEQPDKSYELTTAESKMAIVSDKETFHKRTILFLPDEDVRMGSYVKYDNKTYLVTNISDVDGYPQSFVEHCNYSLEFKTGETTRVQTGVDERGRPVWDYIEKTIPLPCATSSKIYAVLDNSQMPLSEGAMMIKLTYHPEVKIDVNDEFVVHGDKVKITTVSKDDLLFDDNGDLYGFYTLRGQRM